MLVVKAFSVSKHSNVSGGKRVRRLVGGGCLLGLALTVSAAEGFARHTAESSVSRARLHYRQFLEAHDVVMLPARGAALQRALNDCGVAVLREAMRSLRDARRSGIPTRDSIARLTGLSSAGTSLSAIAGALEAMGMGVQRMDRRRRELPDTPFIAHLSIGHFVLVRDVRARHVRLFDPMVGEVQIPVRTFDTLWSGAALGLVPQHEWDGILPRNAAGQVQYTTGLHGRSQ